MYKVGEKAWFCHPFNGRSLSALAEPVFAEIVEIQDAEKEYGCYYIKLPNTAATPSFKFENAFADKKEAYKFFLKQLTRQEAFLEKMIKTFTALQLGIKEQITSAESVNLQQAVTS